MAAASLRRALGCLALLAATVTTGCAAASTSSSSSPPAPTLPLTTQPPTIAAYNAVAAAASATVSGVVHAEITATGTPAGDVHASGDFDLSACTGSLTVGSAAGTGGATVLYSGDSAYLHPAGAPATGKPWQLFNASDATINASDQVVEAVALDPAFLISEIRDAAVSASPGGTASVAGQAVTLYDVAVDLRRARNGLAGPAAALFGQAAVAQLRVAADANNPLLEVRIAVAASGRIVAVEVDQRAIRAGTDTVMLSTGTGAVSVTPPPATEVTDVGNQAGGGEHEVHSEGDGPGS